MHSPDWSDMTCIDFHHLLGSTHLWNEPPKVTCKMGFENKANTTRILPFHDFGWYLKSIFFAQVPSLKPTQYLKMDGWKMSFFLEFSAYFQGRTVSFVGCIQWSFVTHHPEVGNFGSWWWTSTYLRWQTRREIFDGTWPPWEIKLGNVRDWQTCCTSCSDHEEFGIIMIIFFWLTGGRLWSMGPRLLRLYSLYVYKKSQCQLTRALCPEQLLISHMLQPTKKNSAKSKWPLCDQLSGFNVPMNLTYLEVFEPIDGMLDPWNVKTQLLVGGSCLWWPRFTWLQGKILVERCEWLEMPMCKSQGLYIYIYIYIYKCIYLESLILSKIWKLHET